MEADAHVATCLGEKLKRELMGLGNVLGVPLWKSWTRGRMAEAIGRCYREDPGILFYALSLGGARFLRRTLRHPCGRHPMKASVFREMEFLGLIRMPPAGESRNAEAGGGRIGEKGSCPSEGTAVSFFSGTPAERFLLEKRHAGLLRSLDAMEKLLRGMVQAFGLMEEEELVRMAVRLCLEGLGRAGQDEAALSVAMEKALRSLLRSRLSLLDDVWRFHEGGKTYLHHPSVTQPERLRYRIEAGPVPSFKAFSFEELISLGKSRDASCPASLRLSELLRAYGFEEKERMEADVREEGTGGGLEAGRRGLGKRPEIGQERPVRRRERGTGIIRLTSRIRQGAPNLEVVREVMEGLSFEDHQAVERFIERFISYCDDIPRWDLRGYRMNEVG